MLTRIQIAELLAEYRESASAYQQTPTRAPLSERNVNINTVGQNRYGKDNNKTIRDESKLLKMSDASYLEDSGDEDEDESASVSSYAPSSNDTFSTPVRKPTKADVRAHKKARKVAKSQTKALKNQGKHLASVTLADVEEVARVLHGDRHDAIFNGDAHPLATDKTIEDVINRNLSFVKNIQAHKQYLFKSIATGRKEVKERKRLKNRESKGETLEDTVEIDEIISAIMIRLGISPTTASASMMATASASQSIPLRTITNGSTSGRKRTNSHYSKTPSSTPIKGSIGIERSTLAIANKLRNAIKIDLEKHENEVHARYVRAGGFWRYVGKSVFERMTDIARDLDVSTGEKWNKKRVREDTSSENTTQEEIC